jgi:hypothetical protein
MRITSAVAFVLLQVGLVTSSMRAAENPAALETGGNAAAQNPVHAAAQNPLAALENEAKEKAAEVALTKVLNDNLPLTLDAKDVYPTVTTLPGGPFNPTPLKLTADQLDQPLPPGDYTINTLDFCSQYSIHEPGAGLAYVLGPYEGKAAGAIGALIWRGTEQYGINPNSLQAVSWAIQSGLTYGQMPKSYQAIVDQVIPDYKSEITGDFVTNLESTYNSLAKAASLPPLDTILAKLGAPGRLALDAERQRQILTAKNTNDQIMEQTLFQGQESGIYTPVKVETGPWTERVAGQVYMKLLIAGGNMATNNLMQIRVMPSPTANARVQAGAPHLVQASYGEAQVTPAVDNAPITLTNLMEGMLGYAVGQGAQALGQVAVVLKALNPLAVTPAEAAEATLGNPCGLSQDDISKYQNQAAAGTCACMPSRWNVCPNAPTTPTQLWTAQKNAGKALGLSLPEAQIYTDYCIGNKVDGIMFVPQACPDGSPMHAVQFVMRTCADHSDTSCAAVSPIVTTCGTRTLGKWNLDKCPSTAPRTPGKCPNEDYYCPDAGGLISDEPTANASSPSKSPYVLQFYDVLMCGTQVVDAFQWTRTGLPASQAQFCTVPCPAGQSCPIPTIETMAGTYSNLNRVNIDPTMGGNMLDLKEAVCNLENGQQFPDNPLLKAVETYVGCGSKP